MWWSAASIGRERCSTVHRGSRSQVRGSLVADSLLDQSTLYVMLYCVDTLRSAEDMKSAALLPLPLAITTQSGCCHYDKQELQGSELVMVLHR